jgi:hypothetical protein
VGTEIQYPRNPPPAGGPSSTEGVLKELGPGGSLRGELGAQLGLLGAEGGVGQVATG